MDIGESVRGDQIRESHDLGADWVAEYDLYKDGGSPGSCGAPVIAGPEDWSTISTVTARGRITGSRQNIAVQPTLLLAGSSSVPARVQLKVVRDDVALAFEDDAFRQFEVQLFTSRAGQNKSQLKIKVTVNDTASGVAV